MDDCIKIKLFNWFYDYSFGTLWFASEQVVKVRAKHWDANSTRIGHPVVSIRDKPIVGKERIPMLTGHSHKHGKRDTSVSDVFEKGSITWFGSVLLPLTMEDILYFKEPKIKSTKDLVITDIETRLVSKNKRKDKLTKSELSRLKQWVILKEFNHG